jgi:DNA-binding Lrp family transcriptional regulator
MNKNIDEIDKKIVNLMIFDGDITNRDLSLKCNIALGTVNNRIKKLKKLGIIKKKTITVDYEKLGYMIEVLIDLGIKKGEYQAVAKKLLADPNVFMVMDLTGEYDAEILARFHTKRQLDTFIDTRTRLVLDVKREKEIH